MAHLRTHCRDVRVVMQVARQRRQPGQSSNRRPINILRRRPAMRRAIAEAVSGPALTRSTPTSCQGAWRVAREEIARRHRGAAPVMVVDAHNAYLIHAHGRRRQAAGRRALLREAG
jgi:hypothetical protein